MRETILIRLIRTPAVNTQLLFLVLLSGSPSQPPKENPRADIKAEAEEASAIAKKLAAEYVVRLDKSEKMLKMEPEPVLRWTNHLGRRFYGDLYVWTYEGRPEAVASVTTIFTATKSTETEIQSLSTGRPTLSRSEKIVWEPTSPGIQLKPIPGAPKLAATAGVRLLQMRDLAVQFSVIADYGADKEEKEELRLLTTPVYRYQSAEHGVTDGAMFAFTKGTDPDAFLLIEARGKKDEISWQFAFARFNGNCALRSVLKDQGEVWSVDRLSRKMIGDPKQPYFIFR
jgi:hypothetical protein